MVRLFLFPFAHFWYAGLLWAIAASVPAVFLAHKKNRTAAGWAFLCALTGLFLGILAFGWVAFLATRKKLSMRMKYLGLKMEERIAEALRLPSPTEGNLEERLLMVMAYNPQGLRIGALAQGIGQNWRHIQGLVERLLQEGKIRKEGDRYFFNLE